MSYKIVPTDNFSRELKKLVKKYPSLKQTLKEFSEDISTDPRTGISVGHNCYKTRLSIPDKPGGKRKGFRIITYVLFKKDTIFILSIYDKSEVSALTAWEIKQIIKGLDEITA